MRRGTHRALALAALALSAMVSGACSEKMCPTIACVPRISLTYARAVASPYRMSVQVNEVSLVENCPGTRSDLGLTPGVASCDDRQATITGIDLGHADNTFIGVTVSFGGMFAGGSATLQRIVNSRDCDLVCYEHVGTVQN
jgi:hypothetical protein